MAIEIADDCAVRFSFRAPSAANVVHFVLTMPCERDAGLFIAARVTYPLRTDPSAIGASSNFQGSHSTLLGKDAPNLSPPLRACFADHLFGLRLC